ncbi:MAG TPA: DUF2273 domain-containing protein [Clostridiaceae bacterium]|nr:DUF2273 domain-containing protein [Clostridiaceae bacterium]
MNFDKLIEIYNSRKGGINGALIGFLLAVGILVIGFIRMIFIAICVTAGYYIGNKLSQDKDYIRNVLDRILPPGMYR